MKATQHIVSTTCNAIISGLLANGSKVVTPCTVNDSGEVTNLHQYDSVCKGIGSRPLREEIIVDGHRYPMERTCQPDIETVFWRYTK